MVSQKRITAYPAWWLVLLLVWLLFCWDQVQISNLFMFEFLYLFLVYNFINNYWTLLSLIIIFKTGHYVPVIIVSVSLCFVASFLFKRSFLNFLFPEHPFYLMMNNFLLQRPALDIRDLPLFYSMFNSSTMQVRGELYPITWNTWQSLASVRKRRLYWFILSSNPPYWSRSNVGDMSCYGAACGQAQ